MVTYQTAFKLCTIKYLFKGRIETRSVTLLSLQVMTFLVYGCHQHHVDDDFRILMTFYWCLSPRQEVGDLSYLNGQIRNQQISLPASKTYRQHILSPKSVINSDAVLPTSIKVCIKGLEAYFLRSLMNNQYLFFIHLYTWYARD